ncbi:MAG: diaminopimelate decarboxylase [Firmicutes bacterium]|nr:diaminopimelate decarboxylase [Bacillota bacterium]
MFLNGILQVNDKQHLEIGGCDTVELAAEFGTPLYVMDEGLIRANCRRYRQALQRYYRRGGKVIYAGKAFLTLAMAKLVQEEELGLDVVSGGELYLALKAGFPAGDLYFHGNNKTGEELQEALRAGVGRIVIDSLPELEELLGLIRSVQPQEHKTAVLLRVKPGVEARTHDYIQTGQDDSKFGLSFAEAKEAVRRVLAAAPFLELKGFHCHIGSQIFEISSFGLAAQSMLRFMADVRAETGYVAGELDMGGGLGIRYQPEDKPPSIETFVQEVAGAVEKAAGKENYPLPELLLEPGRSIVGEAGLTLYRIGVIKNIPGIRRYCAVDGGMMDNIRPALYQALYTAVLANKAGQDPVEKVTIAGKACESGDLLIEDIYLPAVEKGDILATLSTGAYCYALANNYNCHPRPAVLFVRNGERRLVVRRETNADLVALQES